MTTAALKAKLKEEIDKETRKDVLKTIEILLANDTKEERVQRRMTDMAIRSDEAISKGETTPWEEVRENLQKKIHKQRKDLGHQSKSA